MDLKEELLRQMLHKEVELAKKLEARGKISEASMHYSKAGGIYRRLACAYQYSSCWIYNGFSSRIQKWVKPIQKI